MSSFGTAYTTLEEQELRLLFTRRAVEALTADPLKSSYHEGKAKGDWFAFLHSGSNWLEVYQIGRQDTQPSFVFTDVTPERPL